MTALSRNETKIDPFLKWAGGKRWLIRQDLAIAPQEYDRYIEPFVGGAAIFFSQPSVPFVIADLNPELINCYKAIQSDWKKVENLLRTHQKCHSDQYYYQMRDYKPRLESTRAARFIYLNRTCWNGLFRVNLKGKFNVPRGTKNTVLFETDDFENISERLQSGTIICQDFEKTLSIAGEGDFVFIDPPYTVKHNLNGFLKYNEKIFSWEDQKRLKVMAVSAANRGAKITITNANHDSVKELYKGTGEIVKIERNSVIAGNSAHRGITSEILVRLGWKT